MAVVVGREDRRAALRQALGVTQVHAQHEGKERADDQQEEEGLEPAGHLWGEEMVDQHLPFVWENIFVIRFTQNLPS